MTDKPAATGSGEPLCAKCNKPIRGHDLTGHRIELPTPPASQPTVTLDRETFEKVCTELTRLAQAVCGNDKLRGAEEFYRGYNVVTQRTSAVAADVLALLRAAEQK